MRGVSVLDRPPLLVDMDGVLLDFDRGVEEGVAALNPNAVVAARKNFYIVRDFDPAHRPLVREVVSKAGFFATLPLIEGAREAWEQMAEAGWDPVACTTAHTWSKTCADEKRASLEVHFGLAVATRAIITPDKQDVDGMALIEDRPGHEKWAMAPWELITFDQPAYNAGFENDLRIYGWRAPNFLDVIALGEQRNMARRRGEVTNG